ncbi:MAG: flagellar hook-associated protein FlgL [Armatimonadota bacterium]
MRVSTWRTSERARIGIAKASESLAEAQERAVSGKRIVRPSDDPSSAARAQGIRSAIADAQMYSQNASYAKEMLNQTEAALGDVMSVLQEARQLALSIGSPTLTQEGRAALVMHVDSLKQRLRQLANQSTDGVYLFSGTSAEAPYPESSPGYKGDTGQRTVEIAPGVSVGVTLPGESVFSTGLSDGSTNLFDLLDELGRQVVEGDDPQAMLSAVDASLKRVLTVRTRVGGEIQRAEGAISRMADVKADLQTSLSRTEDVDLADAIVELKRLELVYQTALAVTARIGSLSLTNYL